MDRVTRKIAFELLHPQAVGLVHIEHELYRIAHVYEDGLTEKEKNYLLARQRAIREEREKVHKLSERLKKHGRN